MKRTHILTAVGLLTLLIGGSITCWAQRKTQISDTLYEATGTLASGTATISWPAFTSQDNFPIAQGSTTITISNGSVSVQLVPTIGATPAGTSYTVTYFLQNSVTYTEYWTVPQNGPVTLTQVRTTPVPTPTTTFGEQQLTLGNGLQAVLGVWRQSTAPVATAEGQCYWNTSSHAINCTDQTLTFNALGGSDPTRVSKAGDTMTGSLLASGGSVQLGSTSQPFAGLYQNQSAAGSQSLTTVLNSTGLNLTSNNGNVAADPNNAIAQQLNFTTDATNTNPNFSNETGFQVNMTSLNGQNDGDQAAKKTFLSINAVANHRGAGQRVNIGSTTNCWGMGDCFTSTDQLTMFGGLNASGDEGTAFRSMNLLQGNFPVTATIVSNSPQTTCNTTTTQAITKNIAAQQVTVASTTGCNVGDWVVLGRGAAYETDQKLEAVQLTSVSTGVITGIFLKNHILGDTVTPATVLTLSDLYGMGQLRWMVNNSQPAYNQGTISRVSGLAFLGSSTNWSSNMVGGDSVLPGCVSFAADNYTGAPFSPSSPLIAWYPITQVFSVTDIGYSHLNAAGLKVYEGNGPGNGSYTIRPCARILNMPAFGANSRQVVLETNTFTWNVGDTVENAMSANGVVAGELMRVGWYMPGVDSAGIYNAVNSGAQTLYAGLNVFEQMTTNNDGFTYGVAVAANTTTGLAITGPSSSGIGIQLTSQSEADTKKIAFVGGVNGAAIFGDYNSGGLTLQASTIAPSFAQLNLMGTTASLQGNLTVGSQFFQPKIRLQNTTSSAATSFEWRNVLNSAYYNGDNAIDFYVDVLNRPLLSMAVSAVPSGELGLFSTASATVSANAPSFSIGYAFETFNGISSDRRYIHQRVVPSSGIVGTGGNFAPAEWQLSGTNVIESNPPPPIFAGIKNTGVMRFGSGQTGFLVSFDASGLTANQTVTVPNATGTLALATTPGASGTAPNWSATGTLNIPLASSGGVTAGLLGNADYLSFSGKQNVLTFSAPLLETGTTVACPTCEVQSNKNVASGYAGLTSSGKLVTSQGQKVWAATDLTTYTSTSGQGATALQSTISAPSAGQVLTWSGTDWINQSLPAVTPHNLLSATHGDTTPGSVSRGAIIVGQGASPTWSLLALGGIGRYLRSNGTDLTYSGVAAGGAGACNTNQWVTAANDNAAPTCAQPAFSNLSGTATTGQLPSTVVYNNQSNTYSSGTQDFSSAGVILPKSSDPGSPTNGQVWVNAGSLKYRDNSGSPATQVVEIQSNKNAASGYAGLTSGSVLGAAQFPALIGDITTTAGALTTTLANVVTAGTNTKITYNAKGLVTAGAQAQFSDIGGTLGAAQFPALTGDITTTAGSLTTTLASIVTAGSNTKITYNAKGQVTGGAQAGASDLSNGTTGSGSITLSGAPTITDLTVNQNANGDDTIAGKRKTDTSPTGNLEHFQNAAGNADLWRVDITGTLQAGAVPGANVSGNISGNAGTATALAATPSQCSANQFATGIAAGGNANCSQPSAANLSNGTTGSGGVVLATSPTITTPTIASPTISGALGANLDFGSNASVVEIANDTTTGTGANQLARLNGATSVAIKTSTATTSGIVGIVVGGAGTSGNAQIAQQGRASCAFDGSTIAGDYVQASSSVAGDCHDAGSSYPGSGQVIGQVLTTNGASGTYAVALFSPGIVASAGATGPAGPTGPTGPTGPAGANGSNARAFTWQFYDGGATLTTSSDPLSYLTSPVACTIGGSSSNSVAIAADTGTVTIKFWKVAAGTAVPASSNSISTSGISLSSGTLLVTSSTSDFTTTSISAGDTMRAAITALTGSPTKVTATLFCQ